MATTLSPQCCADSLDLDHVRIDPAWALLIPPEVARRRHVLPLCKIDGTVVVASVSPLDIATHRIVSNYVKHEFSVQLVSPESLQRACSRVFQRTLFEQPNSNVETTALTGRGVDTADASSASDVVSLCDEILGAALLRGASDIHLIPTAQELLVQLRVDGELEVYRQLPSTAQSGVLSRLKVLAGMDIAERRAAQDGRIRSRVGSRDAMVEMRVATLPTRYGERMTLRLLGTHHGQLSLDGLGLRGDDLATFVNASSRPHGLILLTGPTGSGKSTTLYVAIEQLLRTRGGNVITIEDPIEYEIAGASQVEIDSADKVNFSKALRSLLRHDPDVVMIGEIRDSETANVAVKAALTGHLVFSTLHTNNAAGVVTRLIDLGVEPFLIAATLRLSMAQRLVRRLCTNCRQPRELTLTEARLLGQSDLAGATVYEPQGCVQCAGRGTNGRIGLFELMPGSESLSQLISVGNNEQALSAYSQEQGWKSLVDDGIAKLLDGTTNYSQVAEAVLNWCAS